jgi:hypothetical protein
MRKYLLLLLLAPSLLFAQAEFEKIAITESVKDNLATRVMVQDSLTKELKWVLKSSLKTNISIGQKNGTSFGLFSSTGTGVSVPQATTTEAGLLNAADKVLINTIGVKENVANKQNSLAVDGTGTKYPTVDATNAGLVAVRPYKVYTALLSQSGTNAPVATVLENTLGGTVAWSVSSVGLYLGTLTGAFTLNKTVGFISGDQSSDKGYGIDNLSSIDYIRTSTRQAGVLTDNQLNKASIEIRVYN